MPFTKQYTWERPLYSWMDTTTLIIFIITLLLSYYVLFRRPVRLPDGPKPWPIVGNLPLLAKRSRNAHLVFDELYKKYGGVYTFWFGPFCTLIISDIQSIKKVLIQKADVFSDRPLWTYLTQTFYKNIGLIFVNGTRWKERRRWTSTALRDFGVGKRSIEEKIQEEAGYMCTEIAKSSGKEYSVNKLFTQAVSNIICSVCFGQRFSYEDEEFQEILNLYSEAVRINIFTSPINFYPVLRFIPGDLFQVKKMQNMTESIRGFIGNQFKKQEKTFDPNNIRHYIDLCLRKELEGSYDRPDLIVCVVDLLGAGSETSSTGLKWLIFYLIKFSEIQKKCRLEVDTVIGQSRMAAISDRIRMPYVDGTIHELLRHANIVPLAVPHDANSHTTLNGYNIPAHTMVFVNTYSVNMSSEHWNQPQEFRPERWIGNDGKMLKQDAFLPFSTGPRICPGESLAWNELFIFSCTLLQRFTFHAEDVDKLPPLTGNLGVTLSPSDYVVIPESR